VKEGQSHEQPGTVQQLERTGEAQVREEWVEASVWTERMLEALARGVQGGKWHSLNDKVYRPANLRAAWERVSENKGAAGVDRMSIHLFGCELDLHLRKLEEELRKGTYKPMPVRRAWIPKPGSREKRPLGIPAVRDRVVQTALRNVIEPILEKQFLDVSYGFRPGRGCKDALRRVDELLKAGYRWVVDVDIEKYFDSIPHEPLIDEVARLISDGRMLKLIRSYLEQGVLEGLKEWQPENGTPQGAVISPLLANLYLHPGRPEGLRGGVRVGSLCR
jgi:RNA-directed DNA polymerase